MKKIPTLFEREYDSNGRIIGITDKVTKGCEFVLRGYGQATVKYDGSACAILNGVFYKRYDCKKGKNPPENGIPCSDPDEVTGHWPFWIPVNWKDNSNIWFMKAFNNTVNHHDATYEAIGKHFNGNPYNLDIDIMIEHGKDVVKVERTFEGIREYLRTNNIEGLVFWNFDGPQCKIKRTDFGFSWNGKGGRNDG